MALRREKILGICVHSEPNLELLAASGAGHVRLGFPFPFADESCERLTERFTAAVGKARRLREAGFGIMGVTPLAGSRRFDPGTGGEAWMPGLPEWAGEAGGPRHSGTYERSCARIATETAGVVGLWQVGNEMDIDIFRGPLDTDGCVRFLAAGARGLKSVDPGIRTSMNPAHVAPEAMELYRRLYREPDEETEGEAGRLFDYAGIDGYFGSWASGGPERWEAWLDAIWDATGRPVLVHEWGYASLGGGPRPKAGDGSVCESGGFFHAWRSGHSPDEQAEYVARTLELFEAHRRCAGSFLFRWDDAPTCWHCGRSGCPAECGWGLVDLQEKPKPAYHAFKEFAFARRA